MPEQYVLMLELQRDLQPRHRHNRKRSNIPPAESLQANARLASPSTISTAANWSARHQPDTAQETPGSSLTPRL
jgi:hypothetical protein